MEPTGGPLPQDARTAQTGLPEAATAPVEEPRRAEGTAPAQFEAMQNEMLLQDEHRRECKALIAKAIEDSNNQ